MAEKMAAIQAKQDIEIELSTRPAARLWEGRGKTEKRHGIVGIPGFCKLVRGVEQAIKEDDPYADYYYLQLEKSIEDLSFDLDSELKDIQAYIDENTPEAMRLPDIGSKSPKVVPVRFASRLGFQLVYQLLKVDQIVLKTLVANHIGLLGNKEKFQTLDRLERRFRGVLNKVFTFRYTGVTRDDMASNNPKARQAKQLMGELEKGYLDATIRSDNAPQLPAKRLQTLGKIVVKEKQASVPETSKSPEDSDLSSELDRVLESVDKPKPAAKKTTKKKAKAKAKAKTKPKSKIATSLKERLLGSNLA